MPQGIAKVHVSGHASAGELVYCDNLLRPRNVIPGHGEWRHLRANADLAMATGIDPKNVAVVDLVKVRSACTVAPEVRNRQDRDRVLRRRMRY